MSSLWTPGGERPVQRPDQSAAPAPEDMAEDGLTEEEIERRMAELRDQLAQTPVERIVAQAAYQLFEVAALHLSVVPPQLPQARLAIDAFAALVEGLAGRLGPDGDALQDGLTQLRMAFVQVSRGPEAPAS
ncbi:MAG TPA: hypothetical protein VNB24_01635 [Acidimicrobiales bacterium]|nr:hypothetical protein [Acidimicrobiales bacterium]